jgi:predicted metal-dependent enzyme (double-stranded beta helix superfamily)
MSPTGLLLPNDDVARGAVGGLLGFPICGRELLEQLHTDESTVSHDYLAAARRVLERLVKEPGLLKSLPLQRKEQGYTRNLLAGDGLASIWAMVWSPGAATSIHDHHCSCCFGVVSGVVSETWYRAVTASQAVPETQYEREPGYVACMLPTGPNLHCMQNLGTEEAISIHIYGYDHTCHASSVRQEFNALSQ